MLWLIVFAVVALVGLLLGAALGFVGAWHTGRRRLDVLARRMLAETQIEAQTRATLAVMCDAARRGPRR